MSAILASTLSVDEFEAWLQVPENAERSWELDCGRVIQVPPRGTLHGITCGLVVRILANYLFDNNIGYLTTNDSGFIVSRVPPIVRGPDVMLFLQRLDFTSAPLGWSDTAPDLIVEVFSPDDRPGKLHRRISQFFAAGVKLVWVIYPEDRSMTVFLPDQFPIILEESDALDGAEVLPSFRCEVSNLFRTPGAI